MDTTTNWDIPKPDLTDPPDGPAQIGALADYLDENPHGSLAFQQQGVLAGRPVSSGAVPGKPGRRYLVKGDPVPANNGIEWVDTGNGWVAITPTLLDDSITEPKYGTDTVSRRALAPDSVGDTEILTDSVGADELKPGAVGAPEIANALKPSAGAGNATEALRKLGTAAGEAMAGNAGALAADLTAEATARAAADAAHVAAADPHPQYATDAALVAASFVGASGNPRSVLDVGVAGQSRAGRVLTLADFAALGLAAPVGLFNLSDLTNLGTGGALANRGAVAFGSGILGAAAEAAVFTGADKALYIADTGVNDPFRFSQGGSFGCWFRAAAKGVVQVILSKHGVAAGEAGYSIHIKADNTINIAMSTDGANWTAQLSSATDVADDRWHHVVGVWDGGGPGRFYGYLDGVLIGQQAMGARLFPSPVAFNIGARSANAGSAAGSPLFGRVDEVFATPDALSLEQVRFLYATKIAHTLGAVPNRTSARLTRRRKGGALAVGDFPAQPRRLYNFAGGSLADLGANNVALANNGGAPVAPSPDGLRSDAFSFDAATAYLSATDAGLPSGLNPRSFGVWFKTNSTVAAKILMGWGTNAGGRHLLYVTASNHATQPDRLAYDDGVTALYSPAALDDSIWHFAVCVVDNTSADGLRHKMYVDGRLVASSNAALNALVLAGANAFRLGADLLAGQRLNGELSRAFVTDYALTPEQVSKLYAKGGPALPVQNLNPEPVAVNMDANNLYVIGDALNSQDSLELGVAA